MDSPIFRVLMGSRAELRARSSVIEIQIDPLVLTDEIIRVKGIGLNAPPRPGMVGLEDSATGFRAATRQWSDANPRPWCILEGYHIFNPGLSKLTFALKSIRSRKKSLTEIPGHSDLLWSRTIRRLQLVSDHGGVRRALIECEAYSAATVATKIEDELRSLVPAELFKTEFKQLGEIYRPHRTSHNLEQIFLLQLHHANMNLFSDFLQSFTKDYAAPRMLIFDSREVELRRWNLKAIMTDSHLYRQFASLGAELTTTTESLLDVVLALEDSKMQDVKKLAVLGAEIRGSSKDIMTCLSRLSDDLEHNLQLLRLSKDMNQSGNVQMLTLLATIFLPLSLSAGVLSMQSRFKDLGELLYDFFGVVVLFGAGVALLVTVMLLFSSMKELESRFFKYHWYKVMLRPVILMTILGITFTLGALVLASFLVGMFKDVVLGAKILGYGIAAAIVALVVIPCGTLLVFGLLDRESLDMTRFGLDVFCTLWDIRALKKKQNDPESQPKGKEAAADGSQQAGVTVEAGSNGEEGSSTTPTARAGDKPPEEGMPSVTEVEP